MTICSESKVVELTKLASDLYQEGYQCGLSSDEDRWLKAWALTMIAICEGEAYSEALLDSKFKELKELTSE